MSTRRSRVPWKPCAGMTRFASWSSQAAMTASSIGLRGLGITTPSGWRTSNPANRPAGKWSFEQGAARITETLALMDKPVIAKVNGHASSNGQSILFGCDLIVAWEDAIITDNHLGLEEVTDHDGVPHGYPFAMTPRGWGRCSRAVVHAADEGEGVPLPRRRDDGTRPCGDEHRQSRGADAGAGRRYRRPRATAAQAPRPHARAHQTRCEQSACAADEPGVRRVGLRGDARLLGAGRDGFRPHLGFGAQSHE